MTKTAYKFDSESLNSSASVGSPKQPERMTRKAWLAALLSLMLPGLGQLYNARVNLALWVFLLFALISFPGLAFSALYLPDWMTLPTLALCVVLSFSIWIYSIVNAYLTARKEPNEPRQPWQTVGVFVLAFLVCHFLILPYFIQYLRHHQVQAFHIPSGSMSPTVLPGDYLFADMRYNCPNCKTAVQRGDVAIFVNPNNRNQYHIKRIIGLPGDQISVDSGIVSVNGQSLSLDASQTGLEQSGNKNWTVLPLGNNAKLHEIRVPDGNVFVLGDNRSASQDSRAYGALPLADVVGKAKQIWYSSGNDSVRWSRVGQIIR